MRHRGSVEHVRIVVTFSNFQIFFILVFYGILHKVRHLFQYVFTYLHQRILQRIVMITSQNVSHKMSVPSHYFRTYIKEHCIGRVSMYLL